MKLTTGIRKRFSVSNTTKKVAPKDRYRLSISRSSKNISAQIIDDSKNTTFFSASSVEQGYQIWI
jgi:Ribosomal protein L18